MPKPLTDSTIRIVKASVPALEAHGLAITQHMYERMFRNPQIRDLFNQSHQREGAAQPKAVAVAVLAYARNIDNLAALDGAVERIAQKHVALHILPEHYPHVGEALLGAIQDVLGDAASDEVLAAWGEAYWFLAELLIGREATVYREQAAQPGGWTGWRDFVVESVRDESSIIRSFILAPADGGAVLRHKPGQYLGFALDLPGVGAVRRNYSISCAPNPRTYRITVKREATPGVPPGIVSNWLHDAALPGTVLRATAPAGDFFLPRQPPGPVVLLSGGVGLTPMVSMLESLAEAATSHPVFWVHGALNGRVHAMRRHVQDLAAKKDGIRLATFYAEPLPQDRPGVDYDVAGVITPDWLARNTPVGDATYYLCGPRPFLRCLAAGLRALGVPENRVRYEFFGPADELLGADTDLAA